MGLLFSAAGERLVLTGYLNCTAVIDVDRVGVCRSFLFDRQHHTVPLTARRQAVQ